MSIIYKTGDLFELAPEGAFLLQATNCKGAWGSGVARQFQKKYPLDYKEYYKYCDINTKLEGTVLITTNNIICLMVSDSYGKYVSSTKIILENTDLALGRLVHLLPQGAVIYSPKINSGLFRVPWEYTERIIAWFLADRPDITWVVVNYDKTSSR